MKFPEFGSQYVFPEFEAHVLRYWREQRIFERLLANKGKRKIFGFYDGPPFATGTPHYGHLLAGTIKDIIPRYWTMRGYHCERRFGWDCHGLPVEYELEKTLNLSGSLAIREYGIAEFNEACRGIVLRYTGEWRETVERMGRWVDLDNDYKTMNPEFMESIWWGFSELWKRGLIYQGKKVVPYSWRITAPLSNFEAGLNYKSVQDPAITLIFRRKSTIAKEATQGFLAWTTTPWTLPANLALSAHPKINYVRVALRQANSQGIESVWLAEARLEAFAKELAHEEILERKSGAELFGIQYEPLFPFYRDRENQGAFKLISGDFVSSEDGTGFVHTAPAFGEDDFFAAQKAGIELVDPTDESAIFTKAAPPYAGQFVKDADKAIITDLKSQGSLLKQDTLQHNYPFCYRSDTPLIYKAISAWFVNVEAIKEKMIAHNQTIRWVPDHLRDGRFGRWLENARDWCISRNRFWGTPIPVWICGSCKHAQVIAGREELSLIKGAPVTDLHSHHIDAIRFDCPKCRKSESMQRTPEVLDCWFESGSMPWAQMHYPFENQEEFSGSFPADFIAEGLDQTRGWFYTLTVLSTALFDKPAFRNCVVNGMVLAEDGRKMSKSLKNYPDPKHILDEFGADALRLYFLQSPGVHGDELRFSEKLMIEHMRAVMLPLWNAYGFFSSYANIDGFTPALVATAPPTSERHRLDRWILALLKSTETEIHASMERYEIAPVFPLLAKFVDNLTNWYLRLSRARFWAESKPGKLDREKLSAYATLWETLEGFSRLLAPFLPFFSETLHAALKHGVHPRDLAQNSFQSIHETLFDLHRQLSAEDEVLLTQHLPSAELASLEEDAASKAEQKLIAEMRLAQKIILLGRSLRAEAKIGLRQPLAKITLAGLSTAETDLLKDLAGLIYSELNVKAVQVSTDPRSLVVTTVKPNLPRLGPRLGKQLGLVIKALQKWSEAEISQLETSGAQMIGDVRIEREDVLIARTAVAGRCAGALEGLVAEIDTQLSPELLDEGLARELINRIQQRRKAMELNLSDRITIHWQGDAHVSRVLAGANQDLTKLIQGEVLATRLEKSSQAPETEKLELSWGSESAWIAFTLEKIS